LRLLLDEHFDYAIAGQLRRRGVDAVSVKRDRPELEAQEDPQVLRAATSERRVLVTNNVRDFASLVEEFGLRGERHFGVLFTDDDTFPRSDAGIGLLVRALAAIVDQAPDDALMDSCIYLPAP
jgi:predicted nuclease of predicted toxin-antitoxin system